MKRKKLFNEAWREFVDVAFFYPIIYPILDRLAEWMEARRNRGGDSPQPTVGRTLWVHQVHGNDGNDGLTSETALQSFAAALDKAEREYSLVFVIGSDDE